MHATDDLLRVPVGIAALKRLGTQITAPIEKIAAAQVLLKCIAASGGVIIPDHLVGCRAPDSRAPSRHCPPGYQLGRCE